MSTAFGTRPNLSNPKFFPKPGTKPPVTPTWNTEVFAAIAAAEQRGYVRGLAESKKADAVANALRVGRTMVEIATEVATAHGFPTWRDLRARRRARPLVLARQDAMWAIAHETDHSLVEIGRFFGGYDHTTVLHAIRREDLRRKGDG